MTIAFSLISRSCRGFQVNVVLYAAGGVSLSITVNGKKETETLVCDIPFSSFSAEEETSCLGLQIFFSAI
jgi:hypothetical protein